MQSLTSFGKTEFRHTFSISCTNCLSFTQGCQVGPFGAKFHKVGSKYHLLAPTFSFGPLVLFKDGFGLLQKLDLTTQGPL